MVLRETLSNQSTPLATLFRTDKGTLTKRLSPASPQVSCVERDYRPNRRLSRTERTQLAEQYKIGMSALELARQYGIHRHTVVKHLQRDGIVIRGSQVKMTPDMIERAKQLYADGQSLAVIGERPCVDASTVHNVLKKAGVKMRDTHGRQN